MYSILLESEVMEDMESEEEGFCDLERGYMFKSLQHCLILGYVGVHFLSFSVVVNDIAESMVTSTIGTCNSMCIWVLER